MEDVEIERSSKLLTKIIIEDTRMEGIVVRTMERHTMNIDRQSNINQRMTNMAKGN